MFSVALSCVFRVSRHARNVYVPSVCAASQHLRKSECADFCWPAGTRPHYGATVLAASCVLIRMVTLDVAEDGRRRLAD